MVVLNFIMVFIVYDVNVIFDKWKVFLYIESILLVVLREVLESVYFFEKYIYIVNSLGDEFIFIKQKGGSDVFENGYDSLVC